MSAAAIVLLTLAIVWFVGRPLLCAEPAVNPFLDAPSADELSQQHARLVDLLRELELDFAARRIAADAYQSAKKELSAELAAVIKKIDTMQACPP